MAVLESDVGGGDCGFPCRPTELELDLFATPALVTDEAAAAAVVVGTPETITVVETYEHALTPGTWLLCVGTECAGLEVVAGSTTTANVVVGFGFAEIRTFAPDGTAGARSFDVEARLPPSDAGG